MLKNYFKSALRNLWKNKAFSAINIVGLAAGLAVCLSIVLFVFDELSYDKYNPNASRVYRIDADLFYNNTRFLDASSPKPMAYTLVKEYPQVEQMVRFDNRNNILIKKGNENVQDYHAVMADSTFFEVFPMPLLSGNPKTALNDPTSIVIDESAAKRYFNSTDVIGKTLYVDNSVYCKITAVMKDFPRQSHFHFSFIRPLRDNYPGEGSNWLSNNLKSYILLKPGITQEFAQSKVNQLVNTYLSRQLQDMLHALIKDLEGRGSYFHYNLIPLTDIHLHSEKSSEFEANGNINYVYIFSIIAGLILLIACVNFMNLSTARSANRAKEVGIRKVAGSSKGHLITQFLTESILLSFFSLLLALGIVTLLLPFFNQLAGKQMHIGSLFAPGFLAVLVGLVLVVGLLAGSYPAFYLSSFQPIQVLKGKIASGFKSSWLRSTLVVFQFSISIVLIIGTVVIYNQLQYIHNRKVGYNREQVLILHNTYNLGRQIKTFKQELLGFPGVSDATMTGHLPTVGAGNYSQNGWFRDPSLDAKRGIIFADFEVDERYLPTLGMQVVKGRNFSKEFLSDSSAILMNETAVGLLGVKDPLNLILYRPEEKGGKAYHVVGVVKDFNFNSMREKVTPLVMRLSENWGSIALRVNTSNMSGLIGQIENKWKSMAPGQPFTYTFMDNDFNAIYHAEQKMGNIFITFSLFAILIACLGLFGLVTFAAEQRTKEIGIRKVLGANVGGIVMLLSKDFAKLVGIASIIAFPIAWWAMNQWLQGFAYRVSIGWWVFVVSGVIAMSIALLTVSLQTIRAALANPVKSLKTE
ncbi:MAG: ABC transporter permease [Bacteroidetes bacterium]|nr:ABC transporter permease [Bacteroidota bacterium]